MCARFYRNEFNFQIVSYLVGNLIRLSALPRFYTDATTHHDHASKNHRVPFVSVRPCFQRSRRFKSAQQRWPLYLPELINEDLGYYTDNYGPRGEVSDTAVVLQPTIGRRWGGEYRRYERPCRCYPRSYRTHTAKNHFRDLRNALSPSARVDLAGPLF